VELRSGYTRTEVGVVPTAWSVTPLARSVAIAHGFGFQSRYFGRVRGYRLMTPGHFHEAGGFKDVGEKQRFYDGPVSERYLLGKGDLVVAMTEQADGLLGSAALVPVGGVYLHNQRLGKVTTLSKDLSLGFLYRVFNSPTYRVKVRETAAGTKVKHTSPSKLLAIPVAIPPTKAEQEAIAGALSDADALIESLEQLLVKKRHLKQGALQGLLGPSSDWKAVRLGDIADPNRRWSFTGGPFGSNLKASDYTASGVRVIQLQNIGDGEFRNDSEIYTSPQKANDLLSCNIYPGEILLSKMGDPVARACLIPPLHDRYLMCSDGIRLAVDTKRFNAYFIHVVINAPTFRAIAVSAATGSTRKRIGLATLRDLELHCPPLVQQTDVATILMEMSAEIAALEGKLTKARQIKQGMMQELLTGRIRLV